jgi:hypothetical protein
MAVMNVLLQIGTQAKNVTGLDKCDGMALAADFEPFVIKEKELVRKETKLKRVQMIGVQDTLTEERDGHFSFSVDPINAAMTNRKLGLCLLFILATPSDAVALRQLELGSYTFTRNSQNETEMEINPMIDLKPEVIWHSSGFLK